jgi:GT2 family glycosyltransferase
VSPRISVIIVNYNAGLELSQCVQSVAETATDLEILVVDNDSGDQSIQQLHEEYHGEKKLTVLQNDKNLGFAVACNQGSRAAEGESFLYLNPDCIVEPETIPTLLHALQSKSDVGMVGGLILNHDGSEQRGCRRAIPTPWKSLVNSLGLKPLARFNQKLFSDFRLDSEPLPTESIAVDAISGACMLVSRQAFEDVGPMDEEYFLHCEDLDWCMRFGQRNWEILFVPQARLLHSKGSCSASRPVFVEWSKHRGMARFYRKFFADNSPWPMLWVVWLGIWLRFGLSLVKILLRKVFPVGQKK